MTRNGSPPRASRAVPCGSLAVVIGGGMAGLVTARVLADHFERVTVLERDAYPDAAGPRKGVPQARHPHALLVRGQQLLEGLFPGWGAELTAAGALRIEAGSDVAWRTPAGWAVRSPCGLEWLSASRDLLEWGVRRRLRDVPGVTFRTEVDVLGLLAGAGGRVVGVALRGRQGGAPEPLGADLVVDASGRTSRAAQWLQELGYGAPQETVVNAHLGYASTVCEAPSRPFDWKALYVQAQPPSGTRSGLVLPIEGHRCIVMLAGRSGDHPPTDREGFLAFARSLPCPEFYEAARAATPVGPTAAFRATANRWRHFERLPRWPERFVALGDAACTFNPVYGQGMTMAALGAVTLGECLANGSPGHSFQKKLAEVNATPWLLATGEDFRYPGTTGGRPGWRMRLQHRYIDAVVRLTTERADAQARLLRVMHLLEPPTTLFHPSLSFSVLSRALGLGRRAA